MRAATENRQEMKNESCFVSITNRIEREGKNLRRSENMMVFQRGNQNEAVLY